MTIRQPGVRKPRIGFVGLWHGRTSGAWSGVPSRIMDGLEDLGFFGEYLDATPPAGALRALTRARPGGRPGLPMFDPAPRALLGACNAVRRVRFSHRCDAWVIPAMGYGRPVSGTVASLAEITPAQLERTPLEVVRTMWPKITAEQLRAFGRQQLRLHRAANVCCVASHWAGRSLVTDHAIDPGKIRVVGYGANLELDPPAQRDWSTPRFLFIGNGWDRKNGARVVRAFTRLRAGSPTATLDVVGDHPPLDVPGVKPHGRRMIHDPDGRALIASLYQRATCFILPSRLEAFGIVYVEAARAGLPSIGTTVGGGTDSVGSGGVLVDPEDEAAIYRAMVRLANPEEARRLGAAAQRRSGRFTWRKVAERIVRALDLPGADVAGFADPL